MDCVKLRMNGGLYLIDMSSRIISRRLYRQLNVAFWYRSTSFPTSLMSLLDMQDPFPVPSQQKHYVQIVGSILFLSTRSRPDLSFSVNYFSFFMSKASQHQLDFCYNLLKYIWYSRDLTLILFGQLRLHFFVMVDSSYASHIDCKSHYGNNVYPNKNSSSCVSV